MTRVPNPLHPLLALGALILLILLLLQMTAMLVLTLAAAILKAMSLWLKKRLTRLVRTLGRS